MTKITKKLKMARVIKLKESDIANIVRSIIKERQWEMPDLSGLPPDHYPDFDNPFGGMSSGGGGGTTYGGNKGDKSKTHPGRRDYEGQGEEITVESLKQALGNPRTMEDVVSGYEKLYRGNKPVKGLPTPEEFRSKAEEIGTTGGDDGPQMMLWWFAGIVLALAIRWINTGNAPWQWNSDVTLKENIDLVGESKSGINIYEFDYINKKYGNGRYRGVMAQEVPSASFVGPEGTLMVDYSKIDVNFEELN